MRTERRAMNIKVLRSVEEWESLRWEWNAWVEHSLRPSFFLTYDFLRAAWDATGAGSELFLVFVHGDGGRLLGIAPLKKVHRRLLGMSNTVLRPVAEEVAEMEPLLVLEDRRLFCELLVDYLGAISSEWSRLVWNALDTASPLGEVTERRFSASSRYRVQRTGKSLYPSIAATGSWHEYFSGRKAKFRQKLRSSVRRLTQGDPAMLVVVNEPDDVDGALDTYDQLEKRSWKHALSSGINRDAHFRLQFGSFVRASFARGWGEITFLVKGDRVVAGGIGVLCFGTYFYLQTVYDEAEAQFNPGYVLMTVNVWRNMQRGATRIDLMSDYDEYKRNWANCFQECETVIVRKSDPLELLLSWRSRLGDRRRRIRKRLFGAKHDAADAGGTAPVTLVRLGEDVGSALDAAAIRRIFLEDGDGGLSAEEPRGEAAPHCPPGDDERERREIERLVESRNEERARRNWEQADRIRDQLLRMGVLVVDGPDGTRWRRS